MITRDELVGSLDAAGASHHEYETTYLGGVRDEQWAGYYAAFTLGRLPALQVKPSRLTELLQQVNAAAWSEAAADAVLRELGGSN